MDRRHAGDGRMTRSPVKSGTTRHGVYYEVHGKGRPLFLGFPIMASHGAIFGEAQAAVQTAFLDGLTDRYEVLLVDYPNVGNTHVPLPHEMTISRVCDDMLSAA